MACVRLIKNPMTLDDARKAIHTALARVNTAYGQEVFNEWVLVSLRADRGVILAYEGPRAESFKQRFTFDMAAMMKELAGQKLSVGDFAFATTAEGTNYDGCMRVGDTSYLFCNHTERTMDDIRENPLWRAAQKPWVEFSQVIATDPVE